MPSTSTTKARNPIQTITRVVGSKEPIGATLQDANGNAEDLTGLTIKFRMVDRVNGDVELDNVAATIDDAANGQVSYTFSTGLSAGRFALYWIDTTTTPNRRWPVDGPRLYLDVVDEATY